MRRLQQRIEPGLPTKPLPHGSRIICTGKTYKEDNTEMKPGLPAPLLFVLVVVSWGFSWYAIKLQLGDVDPSVSVFWRFFLAALFLGAGLLVSRRLEWVHLNLHPRLAFMGMTLFSMNFLVFYHATEHIASGVVSVIFAGAALFIALFEFLLFHKPPSARIVIGGMAGMIGLGILFSGSIAGNQVLQPQGLTLAVIGTCLFSIGNIVSSRLPEGVHFPSARCHGNGLWGPVLSWDSASRWKRLLPPCVSRLLRRASISQPDCLGGRLSRLPDVGEAGRPVASGIHYRALSADCAERLRDDRRVRLVIALGCRNRIRVLWNRDRIRALSHTCWMVHCARLPCSRVPI